MMPQAQRESIAQNTYAEPSPQGNILDAVAAEQQFRNENPLIYQMMTRSRLDELHAKLRGRRRKICHPCSVCGKPPDECEIGGGWYEEVSGFAGPVGTLPN